MSSSSGQPERGRERRPVVQGCGKATGDSGGSGGGGGGNGFSSRRIIARRVDADTGCRFLPVPPGPSI